jgi:hypothetical protein
MDVRGRDSFIIRSTTDARSIWTVVPQPDWIGYNIPTSWKGDFGWCHLSTAPVCKDFLERL